MDCKTVVRLSDDDTQKLGGLSDALSSPISSVDMTATAPRQAASGVSLRLSVSTNASGRLKHHKEAPNSEIILVIMDDHNHDHSKQRWHKVKNLKDDLKEQLRTLPYPI
jgi:hypothetical protein